MDEPVINKPQETLTEAKTLNETIPANTPILEKDKKGIPYFVWILLVLVIVFPLSALAYLYFSGDLDKYLGKDEEIVEEEEETEEQEEEEREDEEDIEDEEKSISNIWEGDYLKANLPVGWTMETRPLVNDIVGYPGFTLKHGEDVVFEAFQFGATGFECAYSELIVFPDSEPIEGNSIEVGDNELCGLKDIPIIRVEHFTEISLLVNELRRVDDKIYQENKFIDSEYYLTQDPSIPILVYLKDSSGRTLGSKEYGLSDESMYMVDYDLSGLSEEQLLEFDQILESMEIVEEDEDVEVAEDAEVICNSTETFNLTDDDNGISLDISCGDTIVVTLRDPGDGGYDFEDPVFDATKLELVGYTHIAEEEHEVGYVGDFGKGQWTFKSLQTGTDSLVISISQSWDESSREEAFRISYTVK